MPKTDIILRMLIRTLPAAVASTLMSSFALATSLSGPVTFGSPNQPFGMRRPVSAADRALVGDYRLMSPTFSTTFSKPGELQSDWTAQTDDLAALKSCRRPGNVEASNVGARFKTLVAIDCRARWSTGSIFTKVQYSYGFFEATVKIADIKGMNNAFWLTTQDHYEIDVGEVQYPNYSHIGLQYWPTSKSEEHAGVGFGAKFTDNLSYGFHDYGVLWTPKELIFEVDGDPVAALVINGAIKGPANIWLSAALADWAGGGVPDHPEGHGMVVKSLRVIGLKASDR
ncbi:MAG: glycoside hydrolase family 16 protein [Collimonas pratensis]|uniref:glycoside hydrolase family 16 protein n=1 Tax=Collimonas pratensis TaxID=279113 RepID=UPI003C70B5D1